MSGTIINITEGSNFTAASDPMWGVANSTDIAKSSKEYGDTGGVIGSQGKTEGRNADLLAAAFPASTLGLDAYDPKTLYGSLLDGTNSTLALGVRPAEGANDYMGSGYDTTVSTRHLTFAGSPDLTAVDTTSLNIPNAYTPDITNGATYDAADFNDKYPATSNAFPSAGAKPGVAGPDTGLDLDARSATSALSPSTTVSRLGDWTSPTLGKWTNDGVI